MCWLIRLIRREWHRPICRGILVFMTDVTQILSQIEQGDPSAAEQLLPLVYAELRKLAAAKLAQEKPGQTLQATALVHDAYLRLVDVEEAQQWNSRGHFFAAAAEAMRRILVDQARRKRSKRAGGEHRRIELSFVGPVLRGGAELAAHVRAKLDKPGSPPAMDVIYVVRLGDSGRIAALRAWF